MYVHFLAFIIVWRSTVVDLNLPGLEGVVRLWLTKKGFLVELKIFLSVLFTMGDSVTPYQNASQMAPVILGDRRLRNYSFAAGSFFPNKVFMLFDHFDDRLVRAARQVLIAVGNFCAADCVEPWNYMGALIGCPIERLGVSIWAAVSWS